MKYLITRRENGDTKILLCADVFHVEKHMTGKSLKITKDHKQGIISKRNGAFSLHLQFCNVIQTPRSKKLQKALKHI